ncbi:DUF4065 domain-containing protein [candidate division WWE3 bacterium]|nr:DUF4065 domain-containing protein [candidate division WWE3 bacterium]
MSSREKSAKKFPKISNFKFSQEDYILYLLNQPALKEADFYRINKLAFFVEFGYIYKTSRELTPLKYAGINKGPVINDYTSLFAKMEAKGLIKISSGFKVSPLVKPSKNPPKDVRACIDSLIEEYASLSTSKLIALSHETDSYKIATENEEVMGAVIDKNLAHLEAFFEDSADRLDETTVNALPPVETELEAYAFG